MSREQIDCTDTIVLLKQLASYKRFMLAEDYAKKFFNPNMTYEKYVEYHNEEAQKKMELISCIVDGFFPSDIATIVHLHYINNMAIEKCAECMYVSRATAYRLLTKAHTVINTRYQLMMKGGDR